MPPPQAHIANIHKFKLYIYIIEIYICVLWCWHNAYVQCSAPTISEHNHCNQFAQSQPPQQIHIIIWVWNWMKAGNLLAIETNAFGGNTDSLMIYITLEFWIFIGIIDKCVIANRDSISSCMQIVCDVNKILYHPHSTANIEYSM